MFRLEPGTDDTRFNIMGVNAELASGLVGKLTSEDKVTVEQSGESDLNLLGVSAMHVETLLGLMPEEARKALGHEPSNGYTLTLVANQLKLQKQADIMGALGPGVTPPPANG
jgi:hypothetical protein